MDAAKKTEVPVRTREAELRLQRGCDVPALRISGVSKSFGDVQAVRDVNLSIERGEIVAFLGPNGAGKTTTLDMVLGLSKPSDGSLAVYGMSPRQAIDRGLLAAVLQTGGLLTEYTVRELVSMIAGFLSVRGSVDEALKRADLFDIAERRISKCSGGEQQRVRFAIALLSDPDMLILDEPTAGMDVNARRRFWDAMGEEAARGKTIVFATHYLHEAEAFAKRTIIMNRGEVVADDTTTNIRRHFGVQRIAVGFDSSANLRAAAADLSRKTSVAVTAKTLTISSTNTVALAREVLGYDGIESIAITDQSLKDAFERLTDDVPSQNSATTTTEES